MRGEGGRFDGNNNNDQARKLHVNCILLRSVHMVNALCSFFRPGILIRTTSLCVSFEFRCYLHSLCARSEEEESEACRGARFPVKHRLNSLEEGKTTKTLGLYNKSTTGPQNRTYTYPICLHAAKCLQKKERKGPEGERYRQGGMFESVCKMQAFHLIRPPGFFVMMTIRINYTGGMMNEMFIWVRVGNKDGRIGNFFFFRRPAA